MPIAIDPETTFEFVLKRERDLPPDQQTTFTLKHRSLKDERAIVAALDKSNHEGAIMMLRLGLRGWSNFKRADGSEAEFEADSHGCPNDTSIARLSLDDRGEIAAAYQSGGRLTEEERGK